MQLGLCTSATDLGGYFASQNIGVQYSPYDATVYLNGATTTYGSTQRITAVFDFIFDAATGKCWVAVNGTLLGGNPDAGTGEMATFTTTSPVFPVTQAYGISWDVNFGQRPWDYTIATASSFVSLNTYNLPTSTIVKGNTVMDATLYTGNGGASQVITNAGTFKPDLVWMKTRNQAYGHLLFDSIRGTSLYLQSNSTGADISDSTMFSSFNSNGFTVGSSGFTNGSGNTEVGWQWQAGQGSTSTNTNGSITSTVSVNASAGFSVVTYTGTNTATNTVGHGLGVTPNCWLIKNRTSTSNWVFNYVYNGVVYYLFLNSTQAGVAQGSPWSTLPTSSVVTLGGSDTNTCAAANNYVMYPFANISGYSQFGVFTGNGSADGAFIYLGFRPKFFMLKSTTTVEDWFIWDSVRGAYNVNSPVLYPNLNSAEATNSAFDFVSNGIKMRAASSLTYMYLAFAENPFKNSLAR
jgi:hypothetical protein